MLTCVSISYPSWYGHKHTPPQFADIESEAAREIRPCQNAKERQGLATAQTPETAPGRSRYPRRKPPRGRVVFATWLNAFQIRRYQG